jgi:hypothetical protein
VKPSNHSGELFRKYVLERALLWRLAIFSFILSFLLFSASGVFAHQDGCHRWHSCPSDTGSYTCGDLGYPCRYPTYPSYNYIPAYNPPQYKPVDATYNVTPTEHGTYNVYFDWDDSDNQQYSIALHKYAGGDPGPLVDTTYSGYTFWDVTPGTYYVNLKKSIHGYWSTVQYWKVEVPDSVPPQPSPQVLGDRTELMPEQQQPDPFAILAFSATIGAAIFLLSLVVLKIKQFIIWLINS